MDFGRPIVAKFGGSSLANADCFRRVWDIVSAEPNRRYIVVSAPLGVTAQLVRCAELADGDRTASPELSNVLGQICKRIETIGRGLKSTIVDEIVEDIRNRAINFEGGDGLVSRGEWASARLLAELGVCGFADSMNFMRLSADRRVDLMSYDLIKLRLETAGRWVIPGFYGRGPSGVLAFNRGGSDVTGAVVAAGVGACVYENWTSVPGLFSADPRAVSGARAIARASFPAARELTYAGANVLHPDTVLPVRDAGIPINIRSTEEPDDPGTWVGPSAGSEPDPAVLGMAGRGRLITFVVSETGMDEQVGFGNQILQVFTDLGIPFEHTITGIDTMAVTATAEAIEGFVDAVRHRIESLPGLSSPDIDVIRGGGLICIVGESMHEHLGDVVGDIAEVLKEVGVPLLSITAVPKGKSVIIGVPEESLGVATNALHRRLVEGLRISSVVMPDSLSMVASTAPAIPLGRAPSASDGVIT